MGACSPSPPVSSDASLASAVLTQKGNSLRTGWYPGETRLDDADVNPAGFGVLARFPVDGQVYAQPLFVPRVLVGGVRRDLAVVATERDSVYAFDVHARGDDQPVAWHASLLPPGARPISAVRDLDCPAIEPEVGITSTPVIDAAAGIVYVVAASVERGAFVYRIHALDLATGRDRRPPVVIAASVPGTGPTSAAGVLPFQAGIEQQRMGLLLAGGVVYVGFASYCDHYPSYGWLIGYRAADLARVTVYNTAPRTGQTGLWESGTGPVEDGGRILVVTGNGTFDLDSGGTETGNTLLSLVPDGDGMRVADYFTPFDQACLGRHDQDLGSGGPLVLPGSVIVVGKEGRLTVIDRAHLGGYRTVPGPCAELARTDVDSAIQEMGPDTVSGGLFGSEAYFEAGGGAFVYAAGAAGRLTAWSVIGGRALSATPSSVAAETQVYPGAVPAVSSDGGRPGTAIVWVLDDEAGPALRAYDAGDLGHELYDSAARGPRDRLDGHVKFSVPTVADGMVLVGTDAHLVVFGPR